MGIRTVARYLIGNRQAIVELGANPWSVVLGFLFVLSAGFAREYDAADLFEEPWHLLTPLGASLVSSLILFLISSVKRSKPTGSYFRAYLSFLGLFWLTAPLAWLYAIPYERFLTPVEAMQANLATLGLVSIWRVALMMRVLVVHMNYLPVAAFFVVMVFADSVALLALNFVPVPILNVMGGIQTPGPDQVLQGTACAICQLGSCSLPIWIIGALSTLPIARPVRSPISDPAPSAPSFSLWALALVSLAIWAVILPVTQPEQQLRHQVETHFKEGQVGLALAEMSAHVPEDFPPNWDPPPPPHYKWEGQESPQLFEVFEEMSKTSPAPWVRDVYVKKLHEWLWSGYFDPDNQLRMMKLLKTLPERTVLLTASPWPNHQWARHGDFLKQLRSDFGIQKKDESKD